MIRMRGKGRAYLGIGSPFSFVWKRASLFGSEMTKRELKEFLTVYPLIKSELDKKQPSIMIKWYGRRKKIEIPIWGYELEILLQAIMKTEGDVYIKKIIKESFLQGRKDKSLLMDLPITESSYYRIKRHIEEKVYELYIIKGYVTEEEILQNKI